MMDSEEMPPSLSENDLRYFVSHMQATKPPYECPFGNCEKTYKSYRGIVSHISKDHGHNVDEQLTCGSSASTSAQNGLPKANPGPKSLSPLKVAISDHNDLLSPSKVRRSSGTVDTSAEIVIGDQTFTLHFKDSIDVNLVDECNGEISESNSGKGSGRTSPKSDGDGSGSNKSKDDKESKPAFSSSAAASPCEPPQPLYRTIEDYIPPPPFSEEQGFMLGDTAPYIRFSDYSPDKQEKVEYDMDEEDFEWLKYMNEQQEKKVLPRVSEDTFEFLIDRFEKNSHFESKSCVKIDDDAVCCVCDDGECENANAILFCDMCNMAVHQECYGVPYIPEGQWLCRRCQLSPSQPVDCVLCPNKGGAVKQTSDGKWAHVICALWVPEVQFANTVFLEPIDCIDRVPSARWKLSCCVCKQRGVGACIQCHKPTCYTGFHVTCAQQARIYMKIESIGASSPRSGGNGSLPATAAAAAFQIRKSAFCDMHAPSESAQETPAQRKERSQDKLRKARRALAQSKNFKPVISIPVIPKHRLSQIAREVHSLGVRAELMDRLVAYWTLKRESRSGVPLLRRLQVFHQTRKSVGETDELNLKAEIRAWRRLRRDMERVRILMELTRKRERQKHRLLMNYGQSLELELKPFAKFLSNLIELIQHKDIHGVFAAPVSEKEAPGYHSVIKNPMDFSTMNKKASNFEYKSVQDMKADFDLMIDNCLKFNPKGTYHYKLGVKIRKYGSLVFAEAEKKEEDIGFDPDTGMHAVKP